MHNRELENLVAPAVEDVLETMFFSQTFGSSEDDLAVPELEAQVSFVGETSGVLDVRISKASAQTLAAAFLGDLESAITEEQVAQVVCEMTNMLCGRIVSKMAPHRCFDLGSPELMSASTPDTRGAFQVQRSFAIESGILTVSLFSSGSV